MLDQKSLTAYLNGLVLPHLDYVDIIWGDHPGLTTHPKSDCQEDCKSGKMPLAEALTLLRRVPLLAGRFGHRCCRRY